MTTVTHLEILVEEPSMEMFLRGLLPRVIPEPRTFEVHSFQGKSDLLSKLGQRLRGYASFLPRDWRLLIVIDRDDEDCKKLKKRLDEIARDAGLHVRGAAGKRQWQLVNRIAIEELEAWYFGDWQAVCTAYPRVNPNIPKQAGYRDPDAIQGGTWETLERVLKKHGYFKGGLPKMELARTLGAKLEPGHNCSKSFTHFHQAISEVFL